MERICKRDRSHEWCGGDDFLKSVTIPAALLLLTLPVCAGMCGQFERLLKDMYPTQPQISYSLRDLNSWIDSMVILYLFFTSSCADPRLL